MHYQFIEIGTSDFKTEIEFATEKTRGVSIEPVRHYFDRLPDRKNVHRFNCAIGKDHCSVEMFHVNPKYIDSKQVPNWLRGCSTVGNPHPTAKRWLKKSGLEAEDFFLVQPVCMLTLQTVIEACRVSSLSLLKIDTEGMDSKIILWSFDQIRNLMPEKIVFEINELNDEETTEEAIRKLTALGYQEIHRGRDIVLRRSALCYHGK